MPQAKTDAQSPSLPITPATAPASSSPPTRSSSASCSPRACPASFPRAGRSEFSKPSQTHPPLNSNRPMRSLNVRLALCLAVALEAFPGAGGARAEDGSPGSIVEPKPSVTLGMTSPATLAASARVGVGSAVAYRWSLRSLESGRLIQIPQAPEAVADGFSPSNRGRDPHDRRELRPGDPDDDRRRSGARAPRRGSLGSLRPGAPGRAGRARGTGRRHRRSRCARLRRSAARLSARDAARYRR